jgi:hypothetical protein
MSSRGGAGIGGRPRKETPRSGSPVDPVGAMGVAVVGKLSDESLLAGLGSGDPGAAAAFVQRFQRRVFGLTFSILRDRAAAEEAAQESFVRAWRHASPYDARRGDGCGVAADHRPQRVDQHAAHPAVRPDRPRGPPRPGGRATTRGQDPGSGGGLGAATGAVGPASRGPAASAAPGRLLRVLGAGS